MFVCVRACERVPGYVSRYSDEAMLCMVGFRFLAVGIDNRSRVQTGTGDHPAFYAVGKEGSFDGGSAIGA